jgi:hypothetical protein
MKKGHTFSHELYRHEKLIVALLPLKTRFIPKHSTYCAQMGKRGCKMTQ